MRTALPRYTSLSQRVPILPRYFPRLSTLLLSLSLHDSDYRTVPHRTVPYRTLSYDPRFEICLRRFLLF